VTALLATGTHRVIYRPHPRSGVVDHHYGVANKTIIAAIAAANAREPRAQHIYDSGPDLGWQLAAADVAIVDISAMVYDRLATGKPLIITRPVNPTAVIDTSGYLSDCEWLSAEDAGSVGAAVDELTHDDAAVKRLQGWVQRYFGDTTPGVATERLHAAVQHLMDEWERFAKLHDSDIAIVPDVELNPADKS